MNATDRAVWQQERWDWLQRHIDADIADLNARVDAALELRRLVRKQPPADPPKVAGE